MRLTGTGSVATVEVTEAGEVIVHKIDAGGNDLTHAIKWCATHVCPVQVYGDGSSECWQTLVVGWDTRDHQIVAGPWEPAPTPGGEEQ